MKRSITQWLASGLLAALPVAVAAETPPAATAHIEEARDFQALGRVAAEHGVPILLMIASEDCTYCEQLEEEVLAPMRLAGADPREVLLRKLTIESPGAVRDFQGQAIGAGAMAERFHYSVTPTIYLLDAEGHELVPPIPGYTSPDFYPAYLDQAIAAASQLLQRKG